MCTKIYQMNNGVVVHHDTYRKFIPTSDIEMMNALYNGEPTCLLLEVDTVAEKNNEEAVNLTASSFDNILE